MAARDRWSFVEARIAGNCETVAAMVASSLSQPLPSQELAFVAAVKAANSSTVFAVSAVDANMLLVVEETAASNWSAIAATTGSTGCFAVTVRRRETALAASVEGKFGFVGVTLVNNFDCVAEESDTTLGVAVMAASSWQNVFEAKIAGRNLVAEEMIANTR